MLLPHVEHICMQSHRTAMRTSLLRLLTRSLPDCDKVGARAPFPTITRIPTLDATFRRASAFATAELKGSNDSTGSWLRSWFPLDPESGWLRSWFLFDRHCFFGLTTTAKQLELHLFDVVGRSVWCECWRTDGANKWRRARAIGDSKKRRARTIGDIAGSTNTNDRHTTAVMSICTCDS